MEGGSVAAGMVQGGVPMEGRFAGSLLPGASYTSWNVALGQAIGPRQNPRGQSCEMPKHPGKCCPVSPHEQKPTSTLPPVAAIAKPNPPVPKKLLPCRGAQAVTSPHLHSPVSVLQYSASSWHWKVSEDTCVNSIKRSVSATTVNSDNKM